MTYNLGIPQTSADMKLSLAKRSVSGVQLNLAIVDSLIPIATEHNITRLSSHVVELFR